METQKISLHKGLLRLYYNDTVAEQLDSAKPIYFEAVTEQVANLNPSNEFDIKLH